MQRRFTGARYERGARMSSSTACEQRAHGGIALDDRARVGTNRHDPQLGVAGEVYGLFHELATEPGAAQFGRNLDILDAHHAHVGAGELEKAEALAVNAQHELVHAIELLALDGDFMHESNQQSAISNRQSAISNQETTINY